MGSQLGQLFSRLEKVKTDNDLVTWSGEFGESDVSKVFEMQEGRDVAGLIEFWKSKSIEKNFELKHPETLVKTRALYNVQYGMANYVFLADEDGNNLWLLVQSQLLINFFVTYSSAVKNSYGDMRSALSGLKNLYRLDEKSLIYGELPFGFLLSHGKPYHFFYDQLNYFLEFRNDKPVYCNSSFFCPDHKGGKKNEGKVYLFPTVIGSNLLSKSDDLVKGLNEEMESYVYNSSINNGTEWAPVHGEEPNSICFWFGVTGQKRSWLEQVEGCVNIVMELVNYFENVIVYIDGMTAKQGVRATNEEDSYVYEKIKNHLSAIDKVYLVSLIGFDYREKISFCSSVDFFIANSGTGCMVPLRFVKKPGVLHSNTRLFTFPDKYPSCVSRVDNNYVIDVFNGKSSSAMHVSYHICWQHVFNLAAEVINKIKGSNIKYLNVPPVEEVAKHYEEKILKTEVDSGQIS